MSTSKIVIIVLVLLAVFFVVGVAMGVHFNGQGRSICDENQPGDECAKNCEKAGCIPSWTEGLGEAFASLRPKLKSSDLSSVDQRALAAAILSAVPVAVHIPAAEASFFKSKTRTATFRLVQGLAAKIVFSPESPQLIKEDELRKPQVLNLPRTQSSKENDDLRQGSLAITEQGGGLMITCEGPVPCEVELK